MNAQDLINFFKLVPLPQEGGYYRETYRSQELVDDKNSSNKSLKSFSTAIYYCLTPNTNTTFYGKLLTIICWF